MADPRDPRETGLDGEEADLARVLRALPAGEPSGRVDAAILAAARDAASSGRPARRSRGLPGWAIGSAAAAVLAIGIGLQLPTRVPESQPEQAPAEPVAAPAPQARAVEKPVQDAAPAAEPVFAPPPPPPAAPAPEPARQAAKPLPAESLGERKESANLAREAEAREQAEALEDIEVSGSRLRAPPAAAASPAPPPTDEAAFAADSVLPPVEADRRLYPESWLERIRERLRQGDRAGARASLLDYQRTYPRHDIPEDLAPLLQ